MVMSSLAQQITRMTPVASTAAIALEGTVDSLKDQLRQR